MQSLVDGTKINIETFFKIRIVDIAEHKLVPEHYKTSDEKQKPLTESFFKTFLKLLRL